MKIYCDETETGGLIRMLRATSDLPKALIYTYNCVCCRHVSGSECGGGGAGGGAAAPQSARVSSNGAGSMAVSRVPSPLHDGNTPVAENWCFTQVCTYTPSDVYFVSMRVMSIIQLN